MEKVHKNAFKNRRRTHRLVKSNAKASVPLIHRSIWGP